MCQNIFFIFNFFHWLKLDLVKLEKLARDQLCQRTLRMREHIASIYCACSINLLAYTAHTVTNCQRPLCIWQQLLVQSVHRNLLALTAHTLANCQQNAHAVANFQHTLCIRQPIACVKCTHGSKLLAQTAHAGRKNKMTCM